MAVVRDKCLQAKAVDRDAAHAHETALLGHATTALGKIPEANLFYINAPYGDSGAYVWI